MAIKASDVTTGAKYPGTETVAASQEEWNKAVWKEFNDALVIATRILGV